MRTAPTASALVINKGRRILLRIGNGQYALDQSALRRLLGVPDGPPGVGITIDKNRLSFEFAGDEQNVRISTVQLQRRLAKQTPKKGT